MTVHAINGILKKLGDEFAREFPGAITEVTPPADRDRPWVLHAYCIDEADLDRANTRLSELLVDADDSCGDAVGIAHSKAATREFFGDRVARIQHALAARPPIAKARRKASKG